MPKNKGLGGKGFRKGKNTIDESLRELVFKEDGQEYGVITKMLGNSQVLVQCFDESIKRCHIRGKIRKSWLFVGDVILIGTRDFEQGVGDVIYKYLPSEVTNLRNYGELPKDDRKENETSNNIFFEIEDE